MPVPRKGRFTRPNSGRLFKQAAAEEKPADALGGGSNLLVEMLTELEEGGVPTWAAPKRRFGGIPERSKVQPVAAVADGARRPLR